MEYLKVKQHNLSHRAMNPQKGRNDDEGMTQIKIKELGNEPFENTLSSIKSDLEEDVKLFFFQEVVLEPVQNWKKLLKVFNLNTENLCSSDWCVEVSKKKSGGKFGARVCTIFNIPLFGKPIRSTCFNTGWEGDGRPCLCVKTENNYTLVNAHFPQPLSIKRNLGLDNLCSNSVFMSSFSQHLNRLLLQSGGDTKKTILLETNPGIGDLITCGHGYLLNLQRKGLSVENMTEEQLLEETGFLGGNSRGGSYIFISSNMFKVSQQVDKCENDLSKCGSDHLSLTALLSHFRSSEDKVIMGADTNLGYTTEQGGKAQVFLNTKLPTFDSWSFQLLIIPIWLIIDIILSIIWKKLFILQCTFWCVFIFNLSHLIFNSKNKKSEVLCLKIPT